MEVKLYTITKRHNSTLQPSGEPLYSAVARWNDGASNILAPSLRFCIPQNASYLSCNYCHIPLLNRYYFISNWQYNGDGTWTANCEVDTLATWKSQIVNNGSGYLGRSYSNGNGYIVDNVYPATTRFSAYRHGEFTGFSQVPQSGTYIVGVVSDNAPNIGVVAYYQMTPVQMATLAHNMASLDTTAPDQGQWADVTGLSSNVLKSLVNPMQYIVSCKWFPVVVASSGSSETVSLYGWSTGATGTKLNTNTLLPEVTKSWVFEVPFPPDGYSTYPQHSRYNLVTPWGIFDLDPTVCNRIMGRSGDGVHVELLINLITGTGLLRAWYAPIAGGGTYIDLFKQEVPFAIDVPLSQITLDYVSMAKSAIGAAGSIASIATGNVAGGIAGVANGIIDCAAASISPSAQSNGASGAMLTSDYRFIYLQTIHFETVGKDPETFGYPTKTHVSNLIGYTGYVQFDSSTVKISGTSTEQDTVKAFLESGVFIE